MAGVARYTRESLVEAVRAFQTRTGKFPSRDDFKGERKTYYEALLGRDLPHADTLTREFGSWAELRTHCGEAASKYTPLKLAEEVSTRWAEEQLGMVPVQHETGTVDGFIGQQRVEVKGSVLTRASAKEGHYRFRWMIHHRELSKLVDRVILVGVVYDRSENKGKVACVLDIAGKDQLADLVDGRKTLDFSVNTLFGVRESKYWPYLTHINTDLTAHNIEEYLL